MIKRTLYFGNPVRLRLQQNQLVVEYSDEEQENKSVPVEDIGMVLIDHQQVSVTHGIINTLIEHNAAVLWCDNRHMPNGLVLPMSAGHIFTKKLRSQLDASEPLKKQLWKQTIQAKIRNQAGVVEWIGKDAQALRKMASRVWSGDPENIEGQASFVYWKLLFTGDSAFRRHRYGSPPNHMLNYAYAILRAIVARSLVASGCLPAVGIFHRNQYNAFCLADDIMEPYRPVVDRLVLQVLMDHQGDISEELTPELKQELLKVPVLDVVIEKQNSPLMVGMQRTTSSLMKCFEGDSRKINYPEM
ncbi:CRISPR-associated Cas1 family protein [Anseongella ginsenosidimutans]|uniref:CRISPR-associated endonuclease Cas1 n=1 Tax=Anseongella ginsenosidimutans TaxID=496056 RepID=A0A4R3KMX5_9SPHI|nr:type II CRISPR-associated endonuclease Cas1 [Anseongella ginsenosidimutans]QEC52784.1 type II CRISPR-associated endonuclease Cas1 [Anseongella ginsenosidimutans]TCS85544.1 CRISPR-associated Cas1 family protein [Anseongella ginsenosidimutans]